MLSPLSWLLVALLAVCLGSWLHERGRWLRPAGAVIACVAVVAMTPWVANALVGWLEAPGSMPRSCQSSPPQVAVVLAGGVDAEPSGPTDFSALSITSRRRIERAVAWWRDQPGRSLVVSGGPQLAAGVPASALMLVYARRLGVRDDALRAEQVSTSTWENARGLAALSPPIPRRVVLVTSAMHMPRARYAMTRAGFEACPLPADSRLVPFGLPGYLIPGSSALVKTEAALHELVGLVYYRWLDRRWRREETARAAAGP
ncbi:YdcF family protein [Lysobacter koreensis]|uniref:YdcF family protein n=1 Tax=Lysobacter koreensis TaxID=266122 RepID=A0ABW2YHV7_9GAMM